ncbi:MAG: lipopolysaccharide biosynthesis protein [Verrucomicrobiales bacterium]
MAFEANKEMPQEVVEPRLEDAVSAGAETRGWESTPLVGNLKSKTFSSALITACSQAVQLVITMGTTMVLARKIAPEAFGLVAMVMVIFDFLRIFKDAGLSVATIQRESLSEAQISNLFWINTAVGGGVSLLLLISAPFIAWFYREPILVPITVALSGTFLLSGLAVQHLALLKRQMDFKSVAKVQVTALLVSSGIGIGAAWWGAGLWSLVAMQVSQAVAVFILAWFSVDWRPSRPRRDSGTGSLVRFGANVSLSSLIWSIARGSDGLLIGRMYGAEAVGLYTRAGALLMRPLNQCLVPVNDVFVPVLSRLQSDPARYRSTFLQAYECIALGGFFGTGLVLALAEPIVLVVLGTSWSQAIPVFAAFTIMTLYVPLHSTSSWLFSSQGRGSDWLRTAGIMSALTVAGILVGLPFGARGVALSLAVSGLFLQTPVVFWVAGRKGPVHTKDLWRGYLRQAPVWFVVCGSTLLVKFALNSLAPLLQLLVAVPAGLLAGSAFVAIYPPAREVVANLWKAVGSWRGGMVKK